MKQHNTKLCPSTDLQLQLGNITLPLQLEHSSTVYPELAVLSPRGKSIWFNCVSSIKETKAENCLLQRGWTGLFCDFLKNSESERKKKTFKKITSLIVFQREERQNYWKGEHSMRENERKKQAWTQLCYGTVRLLKRCNEGRMGKAFSKSLEGSVVGTVPCHIRVAFSKVSAISAIGYNDFLLGWTCKVAAVGSLFEMTLLESIVMPWKKCSAAIRCMGCWENLSQPPVVWNFMPAGEMVTTLNYQLRQTLSSLGNIIKYVFPQEELYLYTKSSKSRAHSCNPSSGSAACSPPPRDPHTSSKLAPGAGQPRRRPGGGSARRPGTPAG